jgi:hypothetical protein
MQLRQPSWAEDSNSRAKADYPERTETRDTTFFNTIHGMPLTEYFLGDFRACFCTIHTIRYVSRIQLWSAFSCASVSQTSIRLLAQSHNCPRIVHKFIHRGYCRAWSVVISLFPDWRIRRAAAEARWTPMGGLFHPSPRMLGTG